ncbi:hypothetical protein CPAR01_03815 [Colletotrichum paranaense]|uniref:Uncharacterized protein n=1 Tax=Colletotrichum paranaense TaxID=1914294 RepID=A0ABQ9SUK1_9PEZI|nr:uncharacterized protein CPAR01_03815 [Colletotrichum paranaense]KAK1543182.1 hypothetical protein CPAR01_03815 [Colletotrichum paranaense]
MVWSGTGICTNTDGGCRRFWVGSSGGRTDGKGLGFGIQYGPENGVGFSGSCFFFLFFFFASDAFFSLFASTRLQLFCIFLPLVSFAERFSPPTFFLFFHLTSFTLLTVGRYISRIGPSRRATASCHGERRLDLKGNRRRVWKMAEGRNEADAKPKNFP